MTRRRALRTRPAAVVLALALVAGPSGCAGDDGDDEPEPWESGTQTTEGSDEPDGPADAEVVVELTAGATELDVGQTLVVDLGEINTSVGDDWAITTEPAPSVLGAGAQDAEYLGEDDEVGGPTHLRYGFDAVGAGTTTITFQYSFRGSTDTDYRGGPATVDLSVVVAP